MLHFVVLQGSLNIEIELNWDNLQRDLVSAICIFNGNMIFLYNIDHLNGILSQHGAVQLHWRKGQFLTRCHQVSGFSILGMQLDVVWWENLGDVAVLDLGCVGQLLPLDPLRGKA